MPKLHYSPKIVPIKETVLKKKPIGSVECKKGEPKFNYISGPTEIEKSDLSSK